MNKGRLPRSFCIALLSLAMSEIQSEDNRSFADCARCPRMVEVPAGSFVMGSELGEEGRPEGPVHEVQILRPFSMARTETTVAQFRHFVESTAYKPTDRCRTYVEGEWTYSDHHNWKSPGEGVDYTDDSPVVCVSWHDATAYAAWLGKITGKPYRLPSEAEWEYAAGAGTSARYFWGDDPEAGCRYANMYDRSGKERFEFRWRAALCEDGWGTLAPVASLEGNAFGLHDMLGNVWEWTADCYSAPYPPRSDEQIPFQTQGQCERRVARGGSWITRPARHRLAFRGRDPESSAMSYFGFRVARDLPR